MSFLEQEVGPEPQGGLAANADDCSLLSHSGKKNKETNGVQFPFWRFVIDDFREKTLQCLIIANSVGYFSLDIMEKKLYKIKFHKYHQIENKPSPANRNCSK